MSNAHLLHRKIALRQQRQLDTLAAKSTQRRHRTGDERRVGSEHGQGGVPNPLPDVISRWAIGRRTDGLIRLDTRCGKSLDAEAHHGDVFHIGGAFETLPFRTVHACRRYLSTGPLTSLVVERLGCPQRIVTVEDDHRRGIRGTTHDLI